MNHVKRRLLRHGMGLFVLGLLTGLVSANLTNPRLGLAAHLEGVMNGLLLLILGLIWPEVRLSAGRSRTAVWLWLFGAYANWGVTTVAAVFGTGAMTPIAAGGRSAAAWQESVVSAGFIAVALSTLGASVLTLLGLRGGADDARA